MATDEQSGLIESISEDNPFGGLVQDIRADGLSWTEIWELLDEAYRPVDRAAFDEGSGRPPVDDSCSSAVGHNWGTVSVGIKGRGSLTTEKIEECSRCNAVRVNKDVKYVGEVGDD